MQHRHAWDPSTGAHALHGLSAAPKESLLPQQPASTQVFLFGHRDPGIVGTYVHLRTAAGPLLRLTPR
jgi:hypothetical protein